MSSARMVVGSATGLAICASLAARAVSQFPAAAHRLQGALGTALLGRRSWAMVLLGNGALGPRRSGRALGRPALAFSAPSVRSGCCKHAPESARGPMQAESSQIRWEG